MSFSDTAISILYGAGLLLGIIYVTWLVDTILSRRGFAKSSGINHAMVAIIVAFLFLGVAFSARLLPIDVQAQIINIPLFPEVYRAWIKDNLSQRDSALLLRYCAGSTAQVSLADVLSRQGERAVTPLLDALHNTDGAIRACARRALSEPRMAAGVEKNAFALADSLKTVPAAVQPDILAVIASLGERGGEAVTPLREFLLSKAGEKLTLSVVQTLGKIGPPAKTTAGDLIEMFTHAKAEEERIDIAVAITLIGPLRQDARPAILYALQKRGFISEVNARGRKWLRDMK